MVGRFRGTFVKVSKSAIILVWLATASLGVLFSTKASTQEMFVYSFVVPILLASFWYGRTGGLLAAMGSSLVSGSLAIGAPDLLHSSLVQRVLFQVVFFNILAMVTTSLSEREKAAARAKARLYQESLLLLEDLQHARDELSGLNLALEQKVDERTLELERRVEQLDRINHIGQVINSSLELDEVLVRILSSLNEVLEYDSASIMLLKDSVLHVCAGNGMPDPNAVRGQQLPLADYPLNRDVVHSTHALILDDVKADPRWHNNTDLGGRPVRAWIGAPLLVGERAIGMLTIDNYHPSAYSPAHLPLVMAFANQAATALHNAELFEAAQAARIESDSANRLKSQFLANMSHELRTPLNSVINFAYLLTLGVEGPLTPGQQDLITRIGDAGRHLLGLINDILDLAKIEAGRLELFSEEINLYELVDGVMSTTAGLLRDKPVALQRDMPDDLPSLYADRTRVRQVLLNLLSNAAKFTEQGHITLSARAESPSAGQASWVTLSVSDTGIGIAAEDIPKMFAEFVQLDGTPARRVGGTGLGLSISKRFVEMHGGQMWVESQPGTGSTFHFTLPTMPPPPPPIEADTPFTEARVLVIDDDPIACDLVARHLVSGYQVMKMNDSRRALEYVRQERPDVVVLDILMPYQDGWNILKALKQDPDTRNIPVVVCSMLREQRLAFSLGADEYLSKPVNHQELRQVLARFASPGSRVLAVDDDPDALDIVSRMLDGLSYQVFTARDGQAGLAAAREQPPDVVVLDLMMPGLSGFEVLAELRADPRTAHVPVVVVTAKTLTGEERAQLQAKAAVLLQKGQFTPDEFASVVRRAALQALQAKANPQPG